MKIIDATADKTIFKMDGRQTDVTAFLEKGGDNILVRSGNTVVEISRGFGNMRAEPIRRPRAKSYIDV